MVKVTDVKIDVPATVGNKLLLVDIKPRYEYDNNQRTDKVAGYGYTVVLPDKAFEKLTVKIDGHSMSPFLACTSWAYLNSLRMDWCVSF